MERVNAAIPVTRWRRMQSSDDLGLRVPGDADDESQGGVPVEFVLLRGPLSRRNMPLALGDPLVDVETSGSLVSIDEHCVCFGSGRARIEALRPALSEG